MPAPKEFWDAFWSGLAGHVWFRTFAADGKPSDLFLQWPSQADDLVSLLRDPGGVGYVGVGLRDRASASRRSVASVAALWTTVNLDDVPIDRASAALREFPAKPSAGVQVGSVLHAFWFLKEPLSGREEDLNVAWGANRTILSKLMLGDVSHHDPILVKARLQANHLDFDGLFRAPGQPGARFAAWRPEARYTIEEFADLVCPKAPAQAPSPAPQSPVAPQSTVAASPPPAPPPSPLPPVQADIPAKKFEQIVKLAHELWIEGTPVISYLAGMFAHAGMSEGTAKEILRAAAAKGAGRDASRAVEQAEDTYRRLREQQPVGGSGKLEEFFEAQASTEKAKEDARKSLEKLKDALSKLAPPSGGNGGGGGGRTGGGSQPDFDIVRIAKFDSRPARYVVVIRKHGEEEEHPVPCEIDVYSNIKKFRTAYLEVTQNKFIAPIKQWQWECMISRAPLEVVAAPQEATVAGAIRTKLEAFLDEKKENPELGDLKTFPGYNENEMFFHLDAFRRRLRDAGIKAADREVTQVLKDDGWKDDRRWIGGKNPRIWVKAVIKGEGPSNGNGKGGDHGPVPEATPDLFGGEREPGVEG